MCLVGLLGWIFTVRLHSCDTESFVAIRHVKNKARAALHSIKAVLHSCPLPLVSKLAAALITFVVHTSNMVPKINAAGHTQHTQHSQEEYPITRPMPPTRSDKLGSYFLMLHYIIIIYIKL